MKPVRFASFLSLLLGVALLLPTQSFAQAVFGSIFGTVTDPTGAVIPNAKVTVTDVRKGTSEVYTTNESGNYSATHLIPDTYTVKVEAQGFATAESDQIAVNADTGSKFDAQMKTGAQTETVSVTAEAPQLKTDRADVAVEFNQRYVEDLPLFNRNFTSLELLSPGTQKLVGWGHAATENPQGSQQIFVQGQHFSGTAYELDGTDNQDPILGIIVVNPNLDAVTETKVTLQNYDAEFGKAIAGVVTAQTKSGSNEFHGSGFWFRHTDANEARDPFTQFAPDPSTGRLIPQSRFNQFGGTIGGPILKDKLFFFGDYQGTRQVLGVSQQLTIPTAQVASTCNPANTTGAFAGYCVLQQYGPTSAGGNGLVPGNGLIYDPATGNQLTGAGRTPFCGPAGCATEPDWIPVGRLSTQALNILKLFPAATNSGTTNNYVVGGSGPFTQNSFDTRIDYNVTPTLQAFGRFSLDYFNISGKGALGALQGPGFGGSPGAFGLAGSSETHNYSLASGVTKTFSPTLLADFRFGYFKYNPQTHKPDEGTTPANGFGIGSAPGGNPLNQGNLQTSGLPAFFMDGQFSNFGDDLNINRCNCPLTESEQQFQWVGNVTKIVGNHSYKFGADIRWAENLRVPSDQNRTGELFFNKQTTSLAGTGGLDFATFLLGDVSTMNRYVSSTFTAAERQRRWFFYGQDTWRLSPKLTVNYGLRWEDYFPETVNGRGQGGFANVVEGIIRVAGYGPYGLDGNVDNEIGAFAPRLGFSYQLTPKTVIRMGYGRSYDMGVFGSNFGHAVTQNLPVLVAQTVTATNNVNPAASNNVIPAFTLASGPPNFVFPAIPASGVFPLEGPNGNISPKIRPTYQRLPTLDAWNATVQRQLSNTMSLEVAYIGNKGTHTFVGNAQTYDVNQPSIVGFAQGVPEAQRRPLFSHFIYPAFQVPDPNNPGKTIPLTCCSDSLGTYYGNDGSTNYNALEIKVDKRFSQGLQFLTHYTFSHANNFDNNYYVDNPRIAYGPDDENRNNVWISNVVYELPFGRGKMFASGVSKPMEYFVGGWEITNTTNWSSGLPWTATYGECNADEGPDINVCRPNQNGSFQVGVGSFNTSTHNITYFTPLAPFTPGSTGVFTQPGLGNFGNVGRNTFHGPRLFTDDMAVFKNIPITERVRGQFRVDAFNVFNHPVLPFGATQSGGTCIDCGGTNGKITDIEEDTQMRQIQFSVRFTF